MGKAPQAHHLAINASSAEGERTMTLTIIKRYRRFEMLSGKKRLRSEFLRQSLAVNPLFCPDRACFRRDSPSLTEYPDLREFDSQQKDQGGVVSP